MSASLTKRTNMIYLAVIFIVASVAACNRGGGVRNSQPAEQNAAPEVAEPSGDGVEQAEPDTDAAQQSEGVEEQPVEEEAFSGEIPGENIADELEALLDSLLATSEAEDAGLDGLLE